MSAQETLTRKVIEGDKIAHPRSQWEHRHNALCDHWLATHPSRDGGERFDPVLLGMLYVAADMATPAYKEVIRRAARYITALNSLPSQHQPAQSGGES